MAIGPGRRTITRLFRNPLFVCAYTAAWLLLLYLIYFRWNASVALKVLATIPLIFATPSIEDIVVTWRSWRKSKSVHVEDRSAEDHASRPKGEE